MTDKEYRQSKKISNSSLTWFLTSPKYFKLRLDQEIEGEDKSYLYQGRQLHQYILEREIFDKKYIVFDDKDKPTSAQQLKFAKCYLESTETDNDIKLIEAYKANYVTKKKSDDKVLQEAKQLCARIWPYIEFLETLEDDKVVISSSRLEWLKTAENTLKQHSKAYELLFPDEEVLMDADIKIYNELPIEWVHTETGLECKSKLDRLIINHKEKSITLIDLKTTSDLPNFHVSARDYQYGRQLAFYWNAFFYHIHKEDPERAKEIMNTYKFLTYIVAIDTTHLTECKVFNVNIDWLNYGELSYSKILKEIKWHFDNDKWEYSREYYENNGVEEL